jgi:hypothetical protein
MGMAAPPCLESRFSVPGIKASAKTEQETYPGTISPVKEKPLIVANRSEAG